MTEEKDVQGRIDGTFDQPSPAVAELAERYASVLAQRMALQQEENTLKPALLEIMIQDDLMLISLDDGGTVTREHSVKDKIKVKAKKDNED